MWFKLHIVFWFVFYKCNFMQTPQLYFVELFNFNIHIC